MDLIDTSLYTKEFIWFLENWNKTLPFEFCYIQIHFSESLLAEEMQESLSAHSNRQSLSHCTLFLGVGDEVADKESESEEGSR